MFACELHTDVRSLFSGTYLKFQIKRYLGVGSIVDRHTSFVHSLIETRWTIWGQNCYQSGYASDLFATGARHCWL